MRITTQQAGEEQIAKMSSKYNVLLTPRSLPGQMPHADLGALPTFLVYRYTIRLPGVRDLHNSTGKYKIQPVHRLQWCQLHKQPRTLEKRHLQSGFVGSGVVGQPTTVSQALDHPEAENGYKIQLN